VQDEKFVIAELKLRISEELEGVLQNISKLKSRMESQKQDFDKSAGELNETFVSFFSAFKCWRNTWPTLHLWLQSEGEAVSSIHLVAGKSFQ